MLAYETVEKNVGRMQIQDIIPKENANISMEKNQIKMVMLFFCLLLSNEEWERLYCLFMPNYVSGKVL
jgi:hypothetical protein